MATFTQSLMLDVAGRNRYKYVYAKQGDSASRFVNVTILANGVQIVPESGTTAKIRALKPDGTGVYNPATINGDGTITAELTSQMLAVKGNVRADIMLVGSNNEILSTVTFYVQVEEAPAGEVVASSNEFLELVEMISNVTNIYASKPAYKSVIQQGGVWHSNEVARVRELTITGASEQDGTPSTETPIAISNVGNLVADGEHAGQYAVPVKVSGKNLLSASTVLPITVQDGTGIIIIADVQLTAGAYRFSIVDDTGAELPLNANCQVDFRNASNGVLVVGYNSRKVFEITSEKAESIAIFRFTLSSITAHLGNWIGKTIAGVQLEPGSNFTGYEPYHEQATTTLYLDKPLRAGDTYVAAEGKVRRAKGYIASYNGESVGSDWISTTGELTTGAAVEYTLSTPTEEDVTQLSIPHITEGTTVIACDTTTTPMQMEVDYQVDMTAWVHNIESAIAEL